MMFWRLVLLGIWGLAGVAALVVLISAFGNISRQIQNMSEETEAVVDEGGSCGAYGDCDEFKAERGDLASLQRGAAFYSNYCATCHALGYARHERVATDLQIPVALYEKHLLPPGRNIGSLMKIGMAPSDARQWFGVEPPDLTLVTDVRSPEWVYTYLRSFYRDDSRPWGVDNLVFPKVGMPNVLEGLQGEQRLGCVQTPLIADNGGEKRDPVTSAPIYGEQCGRLVHQAGSGTMTPREFDAAVYDLVNYLSYSAAPEEPMRHRIGFFTIIYLIIFAVFSYLLYREYRKDYKS